MPTTGSASSRTLSVCRAIRFSTSNISTGPATIAVTSVTSMVRRSRTMSAISFLATTPMRAGADSVRAMAVTRRGPRRSQEPDESVLEHGLAGLRDQLGGGPGRDDPAVAQDHDRIAERRDFLHHVRAEEEAFAAAPQFAQQVAQRANAHDVETVGGLVEQDRLRVMDERARDGDLHPLALRKSLRAAIGDGGEPQRPDELVDPRVERISGETVQRAVIPDVLAGGEARVESARVRKHADGAPNRVALADDIVRVDATRGRCPGS